MRTITQVMTAATAVAALTLAGCGTTTEDGDSTVNTASEVSADHNSADVDFATAMIAHHTQALDMVELAAERELDPEVEAIADAVDEAQSDEIDTFTTWLETWDQQVPDMGRMSAREMEDMEGENGMEGMNSAMSMRQLENAPDEAFQDVWLALMLAHHKGAVAMADAEIAQGENPDAIALAEQIRDTQSAEIETMQSLIGGGA